MDTRFFTIEEFNANLGREMVLSQDVYERMRLDGLQEYQFCKFDFDYVSDSKEKLDSLRSFLIENYLYDMQVVKKVEGKWTLWGNATKFPVDEENLLYWALDLYQKGFIYDCKLSGYGALVDTPEFPDLDTLKTDYYFNEGINAYHNQNIGLAIINWSTVIKIDSNDYDAYYSRAIAKNELYTWKAAIRDYDKAIELAPDFLSAIVNRGTVKDESGDYNGALEDYNRALELKPDDAMTYFNRGNTKYNLGDKNGACSDWRKAKELGAEYADDRIKENCK